MSYETGQVIQVKSKQGVWCKFVVVSPPDSEGDMQVARHRDQEYGRNEFTFWGGSSGTLPWGECTLKVVANEIRQYEERTRLRRGVAHERGQTILIKSKQGWLHEATILNTIDEDGDVRIQFKDVETAKRDRFHWWHGRETGTSETGSMPVDVSEIYLATESDISQKGATTMHTQINTAAGLIVGQDVLVKATDDTYVSAKVYYVDSDGDVNVTIDSRAASHNYLSWSGGTNQIVGGGRFIVRPSRGNLFQDPSSTVAVERAERRKVSVGDTVYVKTLRETYVPATVCCVDESDNPYHLEFSSDFDGTEVIVDERDNETWEVDSDDNYWFYNNAVYVAKTTTAAPAADLTTATVEQLRARLAELEAQKAAAEREAAEARREADRIRAETQTLRVAPIGRGRKELLGLYWVELDLTGATVDSDGDLGKAQLREAINQHVGTWVRRAKIVKKVD